ncbi:hypothetical protein AB0H91_41140, partial [Nonomuraea fuscirosea]
RSENELAHVLLRLSERHKADHETYHVARDLVRTGDVLEIMDRLSASGRTIVLITHEDDVAAHAKRVIRLVDGEVVEDRRQAPVDGPPPRLPQGEDAA